MIPEESPYGWGVGGLPMPMDAAPAPFRSASSIAPVLFALPWRGLLGSVLLTVTALAILLYLSSHLPTVTARPQSAPVKIIVRLPEQQSPTIKTPDPAPRSKPVPPEVKAPRAAEIAVHRPVPEPTRSAAVPIAAERAPQAAPEAPPAARPVRLLEHEEVSLGPGPNLRPRSAPSTNMAPPERASAVLGRPAAPEPALLHPGKPRPRRSHDESIAAEPTRPATLRVVAGEVNLGIVPTVDEQRFQGSAAAEPHAANRSAMVNLGRAATEELALAPVAAKSQQAPAVSSLPTAAAPSFTHLDGLAAGDLDGNYLVSLNRLRTCRDPQEEMQLRTRLAARLGQPGTCRTGGVVFSILQPETAWSIHVDIYNFAQREFRDRCAALEMAAECLEGVRR